MATDERKLRVLLIQAVYDFLCLFRFSSDVPVLKFVGVGLNRLIDGAETLLFTDLINIQNPVWHYRINYGLHYIFAFIIAVAIIYLILFLVLGVVVRVQDRVEGKKIRGLEAAVNEKLKMAGSDAVYCCRYEDWKYVESYDESPFEEACKYI